MLKPPCGWSSLWLLVMVQRDCHYQAFPRRVCAACWAPRRPRMWRKPSAWWWSCGWEVSGWMDGSWLKMGRVWNGYGCLLKIAFSSTVFLDGALMAKHSFFWMVMDGWLIINNMDGYLMVRVRLMNPVHWLGLVMEIHCLWMVKNTCDWPMAFSWLIDGQ